MLQPLLLLSARYCCCRDRGARKRFSPVDLRLFCPKGNSSSEQYKRRLGQAGVRISLLAPPMPAVSCGIVLLAATPVADHLHTTVRAPLAFERMSAGACPAICTKIGETFAARLSRSVSSIPPARKYLT